MYLRKRFLNFLVILILLLMCISGDYVLAQDSQQDVLAESAGLMSQNKYNDAIALLENLVKNEPNNIQALISLSLSEYYLSRHTEAINFIDKAIILNPQDKQSLYLKGLYLFEMNNCKDAITFFDKALAIDKNFQVALSAKCSALRESAQASEADSCINELFKRK